MVGSISPSGASGNTPPQPKGPNPEYDGSKEGFLNLPEKLTNTFGLSTKRADEITAAIKGVGNQMKTDRSKMQEVEAQERKATQGE